MRLYPATSTGLRRTLAGDVAVVLALCLFAWFGFKVHDGIAELASVGRGVSDAGRAIARTGAQTTDAVNGAFDGVAGQVDGLPLVGGDLSGALRGVPRGATQPIRETAADQGARLVRAGQDAEERTYGLANLAGWLTFLVPALLLLARVLPSRVRGVVRMTRAERTLQNAPEHILAARAAYNLPYRDLVRHTRDPFGDLAAGRHAGLIAALADDAGVRLPGAPGR
jgi:hypothetical protein